MNLAFSLIVKDAPDGHEVLSHIAAAGFAGVEPTFGLEATLPTAADPRASTEKLAALAAKVRLQVPSMRGGPGFWGTFASSDPARRQSALELARKAIEAVKIMGGDTLLIVPGQWEADQTFTTTWKNALETAKRIAEVAEKAGITVGLENVDNRFLLSPRDWMEFLDQVGSPRVRMYFDVGNVIYMRTGHPEQWIRELGEKHICRIHFKDAMPGQVQYLLEGQVNWPAVGSAMREIGYDDWVGVELNLPTHHPGAMLTSTFRAAEAILR